MRFLNHLFLLLLLFLVLNFTLLVSVNFAWDENAAKDKPAVHLHFDYVADGWYGLSGNYKNAADYLGCANLAINFNLEKLLNWQGYTALLNIQNINGGTPNLKVVTLQGFDNIEYDARPNMTYLYQLWIQKQFNAQWSLLFGYDDINTEFYETDSSNILIGPSFGMGATLGQIYPLGPSSFPITGITLRGKYTPTPHYYFQLAVLDASLANPFNPAFSQGPFSSGEGLLTIGEMGYIVLKSKGKNKTGKFALGAWRKGIKADKFLREDLNAEEHPGQAYNQGVYALMDYPLYTSPNNSSRILHGFFGYGCDASSVNLFSQSVDAGFLLNAPFNRDTDTVSLGFAPAWTSQESRAIDPTLPVLEFQNELTYAAVINKWFTLQPDFQYIFFKKGDHQTYKNALLLGLRGILTID